MYEKEVLDIVRNNKGFLATLDGEQPRVRPMKPYVCEHGRIWLFSRLLTKKVDEIHNHDRVEICFVSDEQEVVRISGRLDIYNSMDPAKVTEFKEKMFREMPDMSHYFTGPGDPNVVIYQLHVYHVQYTTNDCDVSTQINIHTEDDPDILFGVNDGRFTLS